MAEQQTKLSNDIKVSIEGGVANIAHSDAYNAYYERFLNGERLSRKEEREKFRIIEAEEAQIAAAQHDPVAFIKQQETKRHGAEAHIPAQAQDVANSAGAGNEATAKTIATQQHEAQGAPAADARPSDAERLERARRAFAEASPEDRAIAQKNLAGVQDVLAKVPYMTHEFLVQAQQKAYVDEGEKLYERNLAANKKDNALTWEVANFAQAPGKNLANVDAGVAVGTGTVGYGAGVSHGFDGKALGLTLAEGNVGVSADSNNAIGAQVGIRAVKQIYGEGDHSVFLAGAADAKLAGLETDPKLGGTATGLVVNTHQLGGRPTSEIVGAVVDLQTGSTTAVGSVSTTFNADTRYAMTARAIGTYAIETGAGGFSLEAYQKTGIDKLTARLSAGVNDVGTTNDVAVNAGLSLGF